MKSLSVWARRSIAACLLVLAVGAADPRAEDLGLLPNVLGAAELYRVDPNTGLALGGRDPVSYHTEHRPGAGSAEWEVAWAGVAWRFAREANRVAFLRSPEAYAPRIGGYDAGAAADGRLVEANPDIFLVESGRLYLFRTEASRTRFGADPTAAPRAETGWLRMQRVLVRG